MLRSNPLMLDVPMTMARMEGRRSKIENERNEISLANVLKYWKMYLEGTVKCNASEKKNKSQNYTWNSLLN